MSKTAPPKRIDVRLLKPHTHAGQALDKGEVIQVDPRTADWLAKRKIAEAAPAAQAAKPNTKES